jgi:hypothetical protein
MTERLKGRWKSIERKTKRDKKNRKKKGQKDRKTLFNTTVHNLT